jgi:RsiW-degrading membrane proteinase PrsW (M82 family)
VLRLNFLIAVLPALGLLLWFRRKDQQRPEPQGLVTRVVLWGVASTVPAVLIEAMLLRGMGSHLAQGQGGFLTAFGVAGATEESLKLCVVLLYVWRKPAFDEVMDGIVYTAAASLGFAVLENLLYSIGDPMVGAVRAFTAVPMHAAMSGIMGYFVGRAKVGVAAPGRWVASGLLCAVLIHGSYDWAVLSHGVFGFGKGSAVLGLVEGIGILLVSIAILFRLIRRALALDEGGVVDALPVALGPPGA